MALRKVFKSSGFGVAGEGSFDEDFAAMVVKFQGKHGIRQTGFVGPLTRAKLNGLHGCDRVKERKEKKEVKVEAKKDIAPTSAPVLLRLDGNVTKLRRGEWNYVIGQHLAAVKLATLTPVSGGEKIVLEQYLKGAEALKIMVPKTIVAGEYQLVVTNSIGASNALTLQVGE
jgi:hypothetical protein